MSLHGADVLKGDAAAGEERAANMLRVGQTAAMAACFPETRRIVEEMGDRVRTVGVSELMKAESSLTCSSVPFDTV